MQDKDYDGDKSTFMYIERVASLLVKLLMMVVCTAVSQAVKPYRPVISIILNPVPASHPYWIAR